MRELKAARNLYCKAVQLPSDVLLEVFKMAQTHIPWRFPHQKPFETFYYSCPYRWLRLTHVCQRWRAIALSAPSLWTTICADSNNTCSLIGKSHKHLLHPELLRRVGEDAPLNILTTVTNSKSPETSGFHSCLPYLSRTRYLDLSCYPAQLPPTPLAPQLQTLTLRLYSRDLYYPPTGSPMPSLFEGTAPSVHSLAIQGANQLSGTRFGNLKNFYLSTYPNGDFTSLVRFLAENPKLEEIVLYNMQLPQPCDLNKYREMQHYVCLPRLRRLAFDKCSGAAMLLSCMQLPTGVACSFQVERKRPDPGDICPSDISSLGNLRDLTRFTLRFEYYVDDFYTVYAVGASSAFRGGPWRGGLGYYIERALKEMSVVFCNAEELWVDGPQLYDMEVQTLRSLILNMGNLQRIFIFVEADISRQTCLEALLPHGDLIPAAFLNEMHITVTLDSQPLYEKLFNVLSSRCSRGTILEHLKLYVRSPILKPAHEQRSPAATDILLKGTMAMLSPLVHNLEIHVDGVLPAMQLNSACTWRSSAPWQPPPWEDEMEEDSSAEEEEEEDEDEYEEDEDYCPCRCHRR